MSADQSTQTSTPRMPSWRSVPLSRLWRRELTSYPGRWSRVVALSIVVLTTIIFYYQYYTISAVGDQVIASTKISFTYFVMINVVSALASSISSLFGGLTDRYGRANVVVVGVLGCALTCLIGFPLAHGGFAVGVLYTLLGAFEGIVLVATPALVRDFSPQVGRATAMGFWTIGPVAGSLLTAAIVTPTVDHVGRWQDEYLIAGLIGLGVFVIAALFLRELSAPLRDQLVVSEREALLADARARGLDTNAVQRSPMRQMLHLDILGSALAISLFLITYYAAVGFLPIFFETVFNYSASRANSLGNWMWGTEAVSLIVFGWMSDRLGVRKPLMLVGAIGSIVMTCFLIHNTSRPRTSYGTWAIDLALLTLFLGLAFAPWMASFTETIERRNPALTGTGLSLWGGIVRFVATVVVFLLPFMVNSATTLIQFGSTVEALASGRDPQLSSSDNAVVKVAAADPRIVTKTQMLASEYKLELITAAKLEPATLSALSSKPSSIGAQITALGQLSGLSRSTVSRALDLNVRYGAEIATAAVIDPVTKARLLRNPNNLSSQAKAVGEIARGLRVSPAAATARLQSLVAVSAADLTFLSVNAQRIDASVAALRALADVPPADLAYLNTYGPPLQSNTVQSKLRYLEVNAPKVQKAVRASAHQWNRYWLLGLIGQIVFIPLIFLMAGYWSPRRAAREAAEHGARVNAELARISGRH